MRLEQIPVRHFCPSGYVGRFCARRFRRSSPPLASHDPLHVPPYQREVRPGADNC